MTTAPEPIGLSIIAPCYNEQDSIPELVRRVNLLSNTLPIGLELILVDDGSRDETWAAIQKAREQYSFVVPVRHAGNAGIVAAWNSGWAASRGRLIVTLDADLQYRPEDIPSMIERLEQGNFDLVQGARVAEVNRQKLRRWLTAGLSGLLNFVFGMKLKDNKSGFILYRRAAMAEVLAASPGFIYFQHFVTVAAHARGLRIAQVPIVFDPRFAGRSFIQHPLKFAMRALADLPRALYEFRLKKSRSIH